MRKVKRKPGDVERLREIVNCHAPAYGGNAGFAKEIGITNSGLLRGIKAGRLSIETLLELVQITNEDGDEVLRAGGQPRFADIIQAHWGDPLTLKTTASDVDKLAGDFEQLLVRMKAELLTTLKAHGRHFSGPSTVPSATLPAGPAAKRPKPPKPRSRAATR